MDECVAPGGPEDRLLLWGKVRDIVGLSRTTAWRLQRTGDFPKPVHLSPGRVGWWESELNSWKRSRSTLTPASSPRLPGMRRLPPPGRRPEPAPPPPPPPPAVLAVQPVKSRRKTTASPNQIDFGF